MLLLNIVILKNEKLEETNLEYKLSLLLNDINDYDYVINIDNKNGCIDDNNSIDDNEDDFIDDNKNMNSNKDNDIDILNNDYSYGFKIELTHTVKRLSLSLITRYDTISDCVWY